MLKQVDYSNRNHGCVPTSSASSFSSVRNPYIKHPRNPYIQTTSPHKQQAIIAPCPHCIPKSPIALKPSPSSPPHDFSSSMQNDAAFVYGEDESEPECPEKKRKELAQAICIGSMKNDKLSKEDAKNIVHQM
eukprot:2009369-Ditylum_brightwellii.AAC.1